MSSTSGISLCNRFKAHSSTTSDLHQSTSATVDTVATSTGFIVNSHRESLDGGAMQRCGLCSLLSRLLRRAMCVGSRRGSGESYYQELAETAIPFQVGDSPTIKTTDDTLYECLVTQIQQEQRQKTLSDNAVKYQISLMNEDRPLIEALSDDERHENARRNQLSNGRFLTIHKRRRKKLATRALNQDIAILDDILHGQVQCILNQVGNWRFNAFTLETVTGGRSLPVLCVHLFHWYGLLDHFNLDVVRLWKLFTLIEEGYHSTNPYHNSIHATDVTQAMHCFLQENKIIEHMEPIEIMSSLLGAVTHDLDHPGVNQPFLIATSNHLAALYENTSVLENHHWRSAVGCLLESGIAEQIHDIRPIVEKQIASLILATDITRQTEFLAKFRKFLDTNTLNMQILENRHFILQISLKCADISNPCRPWDISKKWSQKVCEEFFRQGDYERQLNLPVTSLCDRFSTSVPKIQVGFFKYVVTPLFNEWHRFLDTKLSTKMMKHLRENEVQWESRVDAELAEETKTEISDADILEEGIDDDEEADICIELSDSSEVLLPEIKMPRRSSLQIPKYGDARFDRRHSVPVNPPKIILQRERLSRSAIRENMEAKFEDSFSVLSSDSDSGRRKSSITSFAGQERPLSSETLLPEFNITTMSNSDCADRLNIMMHGGTPTYSAIMLSANSASKQLIRQQTFPPLQPYVRTRYMSATAEMSGCSDMCDKLSGSSDSQNENGDFSKIFKDTVKDSYKRDQKYYYEKSQKMSKNLYPGQKENRDPTKSISSRRRGSVPVDMPLFGKSSSIEEHVAFTMKSCDKFSRRGSVPVEMMPSHQKQCESFLNTSLNISKFQRRGSIPFDNSSRNNCNGKAKNRKKIFRRRSGGSEIVNPALPAETESGNSTTQQAWYRFKRSERQRGDVESFLTRRRGSLPVEVLGACHTGTLRH